MSIFIDKQAEASMKSTRKTGIILSRIFIGLLILILVIVAAFQLSVRPGVFVISQMFKQPVIILNPEEYATASQKVNHEKNITYYSTFLYNSLYIFYLAGDLYNSWVYMLVLCNEHSA